MFLAFVWPLYWLMRRRLSAQNALLLITSYLFYAWWEWRFVPILLASTLVDYGMGRVLARTTAIRRRRAAVAVSCATNLGMLGFFKYWDFFARTSNGVGAWLGLEELFPELHVLLPIGISFYTFQSMAYTIDVYRGSFRPWRSFPEFATYVSFFPQLVAGPIERPGRLLEAVAQPRRMSLARAEEGAFLFAAGWLMKSVGDILGDVAGPVFAHPAAHGSWPLLWGVYAFTFQVYCDFLGYSQMARGVAKFFGFDLMMNFRAPLLATRLPELWARWHISLTSWLRDYLFIPLGGSRGGTARALLNVFLTMFLAGLWHGAGWGYLLWGIYMGAFLVLYRLLQMYGPFAVPSVIGVLMTFHTFAFGMVLFRAQAGLETSLIENVGDHFTGLLALPTAAWEAPPIALWVIAVPVVFDILQLRHDDDYWVRSWSPVARGLVTGLLATAAIVLGSPHPEAFIYFQF